MVNGIEKWHIAQPGGPQGPFYSIVAQSGLVIAMQIPERKTAELFVKLSRAMLGNFDVIDEAGKRLRSILERDFVGDVPHLLDEGAEDYLIEAVVEALFGENDEV